MLEGASMERTMWEMRFAAYDSRSVETLRDSERRLAAFTRRLDLWRDYARQQLEASSSQIQLQETRLNNLAPDSDLLLAGPRTPGAPCANASGCCCASCAASNAWSA